MKKTIITLTAGILLMHAASAQKTQVGFTAGASLSNFNVKEEGEDVSANAKIGLTAGLILNIAAGKNFIVQTGAHWVQKGTKEEESFGGETYKVSITNNHIEVPVNFLFNSGGFFAGGGPSISFAVSGKLKVEYNGEKETQKVNFGSGEDDDMKSLDLGANILAGYQFPCGFLIMANFNKGLSNLMTGGTDTDKLKTHYFGIRVGYVLKGKK